MDWESLRAAIYASTRQEDKTCVCHVQLVKGKNQIVGKSYITLKIECWIFYGALYSCIACAVYNYVRVRLCQYFIYAHRT